MVEAGFEALFHISQTSFMGFVEVAKNWGIIRSMFARCRAAMVERRPSAVVLIDYPGFNMRFAAHAASRRHSRGLFHLPAGVGLGEKARAKDGVTGGSPGGGFPI